MLLSFFWELPLWYMSSFNRINPRLYDVFFLLGLLIFQKKIFTISCDNKVYNIWKKIVVWFCICAVFYAMIESLDIVMYSILCVTRYIQGLLVIKMFLLLPHNQVEKAINRCCWIGLIVLSLYCLFELKSGTGSQLKDIEIAPGKFVITYGNVLFGPLSFSYFHLGQLIPLAFVIVACQAIRKNFYLLFPALLLAWPALWCGSRTAMGILVVCVAGIFFLAVRRSPWSLCLLACVLGIIVIFHWQELFSFMESAGSIERFEMYMDSEDHSISARMKRWEWLFALDQYKYWYLLPFVGAGFNFAPMNNVYRIDYGIHCSPIYPFEQAGIVGFILFLIFIICAFRTMWQYRNQNNLSFSGIIYLIATLVCGIAGAHNFWREFGTGNTNTLIVLTFCLAAQTSAKQQNLKNDLNIKNIKGH